MYTVVRGKFNQENQSFEFFLKNAMKLTIVLNNGAIPTPAVRWVNHNLGREVWDKPELAVLRHFKDLPDISTDFIMVTLI